MKQKIKNAEELVTAICNILGESVEDIKSKSRKDKFVRVRHYIGYVGVECYCFKLKPLGSAMGGRDHTTIIHNHRTITTLLESKDAETIETLSKIKSVLMIRKKGAEGYKKLKRSYDRVLANNKLLKNNLDKALFDLKILRIKMNSKKINL